MNEKKILVTSALPYVNNVPHLGNIIPMLSADVYSRFQKLKGNNCIYVCGTDEHGTTAEIKANQEGISPKELVDKYYKIHKQIYDWFEFDFDCFGRTSSKKNFEISQDIFKNLYKNGFIIEDTIIQMWDEKEQRFLSDRFIEGVCPHCGYNKARGDQCDSCNKLLDPVDLINPVSIISGTTPIKKESKHLFIDLKKIETNSKLEEDLSSWIEKNKDKWTNNAITTTFAWIKEGLRPRCITRDLSWGIPVPAKELNLSKEFEKKVFYSWFDAPIGYISITAEFRDDWKNWWMNKEDTKLVQFMGKDNIPFHTILFPSFCIGAKSNYTLMNEISVNEFINYQGGKFAKSRGIGVFGDNAMDSGIDPDIYRFYLMAIRPEKEDTDFDWIDLQTKVNKELIGNFGNLVNRVLTFIKNFNDGKIKDSEDYKGLDCDFNSVYDSVNKFRIKEALQKILKISNEGNIYFQTEELWNKIKSNKEECIKDLAILSRNVRDIAILIYPFMPKTSKEIFKQMNLDVEDISLDNIGKPLPNNHKINSHFVSPLFRKLEIGEITNLKNKYSGNSDKSTFPLDLRVARIISAKNHPDAEKLIILEVDVGLEKRQIVAGLKQHYSQEDLIDKKVVLLCNLKPAKLRGYESQGMILAGVSKTEDKVYLISPKHSKIGQQVYFQGKNSISKEIIDYEVFSKVEMNINEKLIYLNDPKNNLKLQTDTEVISVNLNSGKVY